MKKLILSFLILFSTSILAQVIISPSAFEVSESITITVDSNSTATDCNGFNNPTKVYMHSGVGTDSNPWTHVVGNWGQDDGVGEMTSNGDGTFSITITPETYYSLTPQQAATITRMGMVFRSANGSQEFKDNGCQDFFFNVGSFQIKLNTPTSSTTIIDSGSSFPISATSSQTADFTLKVNGATINQQNGITDYSFSPVLNETTQFVLEANNGTEIKSISFEAIVRPTVTEAPVPSGMKDGINLNTSDNTKATLVFYAPGKEFVHVIGDFNNWETNDGYLLKKDSATDRFWIELTGLTPQSDHMYQYLIEGVLRVADPYSTLILDENEDQYINDTRFPNLPSYPTGNTNHAVTWLRTGNASYNWQVTNFQAPKKTDLIIYELLIRDFDSEQTFDAIKARLDYLQDLGINAIEFMPLNEFDGNLSWGYNPSFHMALDKYYGSPMAFKQLVDECHARGMAVIVDVVFNHATGQNPFYRMWNTNNGGYQGIASNDSPFFNASPTHDFNVFNDFNHDSQATQDYVKRVTQYWIEEYNIDGFRWDLSKGFTQKNTVGNVGLWGQYDSDRVELLKKYADYQWDINPDFYVILEHFADNSEETELINYRLNEGKGMMVWGNHHGAYKEAALGYHENGKSDFSWISYKNRSWSTPQNVSFMVSHDEERLMYENLNYGTSGESYNTSDFSTALDRMELIGAFFFTIPGPKMIWQFDELGYDYSINYCIGNGSISNNCRTGEKPIRWDYFSNQERKDIYNTWSKLMKLKTSYDVFKTSDFILDVDNSNGIKRVLLSDPGVSDLQYVVVLGNFGTTEQVISNPGFQVTGTWYDLLNNNTTLSAFDAGLPQTLQPGEFKVYGNMPVSLSTREEALLVQEVVIYPNPSSEYFLMNINTKKVELFDIRGKRVKSFRNTSRNTEFSIYELNSGIYYVKITTNHNEKIVKKLIVN